MSLAALPLPDLLHELDSLAARVCVLESELTELRAERLPDLLSREALSARTGIPAETIKKYLALAELNDLASAVVRRGRSISFDVAQFNAWLRGGGPARHAAAVRELRRPRR